MPVIIPPSPAIGAGRTLYIGCGNKLYAFADPAQPEVCDGLDNDLNGQVDKGCGDLNADGKITPADALIAFDCYLKAVVCPDY